ncbi:GPW/gp25 family protein [Paracoccus caeni]|uniref:GPW/gp25 family protein n=1 Tax=Paracoccus caeni TaxID=657651 RepID=A0A934SFK3_9RHOB|nr:GPW/gp25 family protein [Paracoccus caeni]MBK4216489.1 GPW/gp25 family protein [Paracoccus caeni]
MAEADPRLTGPRPYLGVGWAFPVRPVGGRLTWARYEEDVEQAVEMILRVNPGERVMLPAHGAGLRRFLFSPNTSVIHRRVEDAVRSALLDQEPRITVERVTALADPDDPNLMRIEIDYVVRRSNAFYNMVYPFYLNEGD